MPLNITDQKKHLLSPEAFTEQENLTYFILNLGVVKYENAFNSRCTGVLSRR